MLGRRLCAASLCALFSWLLAPHPATAGDPQPAASADQEPIPLSRVPVPVPAVRRVASVPPPPPAAPPPTEVDPIENLAGKWSGEGTMLAAYGRNEQFRCVITYTVREDASRVRQHLRCQGSRNRFDAVTSMLIEDERVTGEWADNVYSISGTLAGKVTDKGFDIRLDSYYFQARMTVAATACEQSVKVVPETRGTIGPLTAALKKC
jgi:hypothetical protein